jgi:hypothetical protein
MARFHDTAERGHAERCSVRRQGGKGVAHPRIRWQIGGGDDSPNQRRAVVRA